jgi:acetylornithine deacetylase
MKKELTEKAIVLLKDLISIQSFSGEEDKTANRIEKWFIENEIIFNRSKNNIWALNRYYDSNKPTLLLNSHHDTVKPNTAYTRNPYKADIENGKIYGLGSNDAGGALVSLIALFTFYYKQKKLKYNLVIAASGEEEIAGINSLRGLIPKLPSIDLAIIGEPTEMNLAIAEKGLIVFDGVINGTATHAAHYNNDSAIMKLPKVLEWFENFSFEKKSNLLGPVKITITQIHSGKEHNVIPAKVNLVIDVRVNDKYTNEDVSEILMKEAPCKLIPRSLGLGSSSIDINHELVQSGISIKRITYGSPTLSDQAALSCPSLKMGPGLSTRSHTANEYIYINEIDEAIEIYIQLLKKIL